MYVDKLTTFTLEEGGYIGFTITAGVKKSDGERETKNLNTVVHGSLRTGDPWYVITQLRAVP